MKAILPWPLLINAHLWNNQLNFASNQDYEKKLFLAKISNTCLKIALFQFQIGFKEYIQKKKKAKKITGKKTRMGVRSNRAPDES